MLNGITTDLWGREIFIFFKLVEWMGRRKENIYSLKENGIFSHNQQLITSLNPKSKNSSVEITCWKFCNANRCDLVCNSLHEWMPVEKQKK